MTTLQKEYDKIIDGVKWRIALSHLTAEYEAEQKRHR